MKTAKKNIDRYRKMRKDGPLSRKGFAAAYRTRIVDECINPLGALTVQIKGDGGDVQELDRLKNKAWELLNLG